VGETALVDAEVWVPVERDVRQQVMVLYLSGSALDTHVIAWSLYDPVATAVRQVGEEDEPPYPTGLDALRDGWRLLTMSQLFAPPRGLEYSTDQHNFEFVFERLVARRPGREEER